MRVKFETIGGVSTRYYQAGSGYPLVLVHGVGMTADSWLLNVPVLGRQFSVFAPDLLDNGFTGSGAYTGGPPHAHMLDHLAHFVDHLKLDRFALAGSSFGALLAILLYFRMPKRIERLIVISSSSSLRQPETLTPEYARAYKNARSAALDPTYEVTRNRMAQIFYDPARIPESLLMLQLTTNALPNALPSLDRRLPGMMDPDAIRPFSVADRLGEIAIPTLAIYGKQDPRSDYNEAMEKTRRIPNCKLVVVDQCGHLPHLEHPETFNRAVVEFLGDRIQAPELRKAQ
jgi:pimeloyl-ACP methyl ester carboxylesterase